MKKKLNKNNTYTIKFERQKKYLYAFVYGEEDNYKISCEYWSEIANECRNHDYKKVVVEEDFKVDLSFVEMFKFASELRSLGFGGIIIAFVDRQLKHSANNLFGETVATNRGCIGKVFSSVKDAEEWIVLQ